MQFYFFADVTLPKQCIMRTALW